jgi:hypothetical protein
MGGNDAGLGRRDIRAGAARRDLGFKRIPESGGAEELSLLRETAFEQPISGVWDGKQGSIGVRLRGSTVQEFVDDCCQELSWGAAFDSGPVLLEGK